MLQWPVQMILIDGRKIRDEILASLKTRVAGLPFTPVFCDVLVGDSTVSAQYVRMKEKIAEGLGIATHHAVFPADISTDALIAEIEKISAIPHMAGLIVQLPLPETVDRERVLNAVPVSMDVDATGHEASTRFYSGDPVFIFPTAAASVAVLDSQGIDLSDKKIAVVGQGMLVGKPVTHLLKSRGLDVVAVDKHTENPEEIFASSDVIITAVGKAGLIHGPALKQGVVIVDAGTSESGGGIVGDVDRESVEPIAGALSPVPGGVGPVTVAMLMQNVVISAERMNI